MIGQDGWVESPGDSPRTPHVVDEWREDGSEHPHDIIVVYVVCGVSPRGTPPIHPPIHPSTHPAIHPPTHPPIHPSIHPELLDSRTTGKKYGRIG